MCPTCLPLTQGLSIGGHVSELKTRIRKAFKRSSHTALAEKVVEVSQLKLPKSFEPAAVTNSKQTLWENSTDGKQMTAERKENQV